MRIFGGHQAETALVAERAAVRTAAAFGAPGARRRKLRGQRALPAGGHLCQLLLKAHRTVAGGGRCPCRRQPRTAAHDNTQQSAVLLCTARR